MGSDLLSEYVHLLKYLKSYKNIPEDLIFSFRHYVLLIHRSDLQNKFGEPMLWIGIYIALASLLCVLAIVADLIHGFRVRKLWFPCKYFTLNAASLTVIAVTIKLPMDLNNSMPGNTDQMAKLGSMAFMCTIMANLLPSLATMDNKELLTNMIALGVLVITLVVNVCIQISTGVLSYYENDEKLLEVIADIGLSGYVYVSMNGIAATIFVSLLLMLLIIHVSSSLAILKSKQILESKYQAGHEASLKGLQLGTLTVEKLKEHVSNHWIMASTGSPQFIMACSATSSASGVICAFSTVLYTFIIILTIIQSSWAYESDYKWSMLVILVIQFVGIILGTIAPFFRCFADLNFEFSIKWIWNHIKVFKVEIYWTQKLSDWKQSSIPFSSSSRNTKIVVHNLKIIFLSICIGLQKIVVVACKMVWLSLIFFVMCFLCCSHCWRWLKTMFIASGIVFGEKTEQLEDNKDLSHYVLQLHEDMEFDERTLKGISESVNRLILKAEKQQPNNLMKLLDESTSFQGVERYDSHHVSPLSSKEYLDCWSLTLVTLTTIAISLPNIQKAKVDGLLSSVSEGLAYVTLVEENLNAAEDYVSIQKASNTMWLEVEVYHKWLGNKLRKLAPKESTVGQILQQFKDKAKNMVTEVESMDIGGQNDKYICRYICGNSMYRITQTIMLYYQNNIDEVSQEKLFLQLSSMIADILAACLSNLPQVISMKCHTSVIEKREASVREAAQLLGETMQIINRLQKRELPTLNSDELPFMDKWQAYLKHPFP